MKTLTNDLVLMAEKGDRIKVGYANVMFPRNMVEKYGMKYINILQSDIGDDYITIQSGKKENSERTVNKFTIKDNTYYKTTSVKGMRGAKWFGFYALINVKDIYGVKHMVFRKEFKKPKCTL